MVYLRKWSGKGGKARYGLVYAIKAKIKKNETRNHVINDNSVFVFNANKNRKSNTFRVREKTKNVGSKKKKST